MGLDTNPIAVTTVRARERLHVLTHGVDLGKGGGKMFEEWLEPIGMQRSLRLAEVQHFVPVTFPGADLDVAAVAGDGDGVIVHVLEQMDNPALQNNVKITLAAQCGDQA